MADTPTIPSSFSNPEGAVAATDVIPGSEVQKATAIGQGTLPEPPRWSPSTRAQVFDSLSILGGMLTDIGGATKGATGKAAEGMRALRDDMASRQSMAYFTQLQTAALNDPTLARPALKALTDFVAENAAYLPMPLQIAASHQLMPLLKGIAQKDSLRQAIIGIGPNAPYRIQVAQRMLTLDPLADPADIEKFTNMFPQDQHKIITDQVGNMFDVQMQADGSVAKATPISLPGYIGGKGLEEYNKLDTYQRSALNRILLGQEGQSTPIEVMNKAISGDKMALGVVELARQQGLKDKMDEDEKLVAYKDAKEYARHKQELLDKRDELPDAQRRDFRAAGIGDFKTYSEVDKNPGAETRLRTWQANQKSFDNKMEKVSSRQLDLVKFDEKGNLQSVPYNEDSRDEYRDALKAGTMFAVSKEQFKEMGTLMAVQKQLQTYHAVSQMLLKSRDALPGTTLGEWIKNTVAGTAGRGTITGHEVALMQSMSRELGAQITKILAGTVRSNFLAAAGEQMLGNTKDTLELERDKSAILLERLQDVIRWDLGAPGATSPTFDLEELERRLPSLKGRFQADSGLPPVAAPGATEPRTPAGAVPRWKK